MLWIEESWRRNKLLVLKKVSSNEGTWTNNYARPLFSPPFPQAFLFPLFHSVLNLQGEAFCCDSHGLGTKASQLPHSKHLLSQFHLVLFVSYA